MPTTTTDIHPHIISNDPARYPLAPLGSHQSDWSRTRPVTVEQLVAAMDTTGVQKAAIVQASTCYGARQLLRRGCSRRLSEPLHRRLLSRCTCGGCLGTYALLVRQRPDWHASFHTRQHDVRTG